MQFLIVFGTVVFLGFIIWLMRQYKNSKVMPFLSVQAKKRNGRTKAGILAPSLTFAFEGDVIKVMVVSGGTSLPPETYVETSYRLAKSFRLSVNPKGAVDKFKENLGAQGVQINNPEFDNAFIISADDQLVLRQWLDKELQNMILQFPGRDVSIVISDCILSVSKHGFPHSDEELDQLINIALLAIKKIKQVGN